eukprot:2552923-Prymnesium_polylepis.1
MVARPPSTRRDILPVKFPGTVPRAQVNFPGSQTNGLKIRADRPGRTPGAGCRPTLGGVRRASSIARRAWADARWSRLNQSINAFSQAASGPRIVLTRTGRQPASRPASVRL